MFDLFAMKPRLSLTTCDESVVLVIAVPLGFMGRAPRLDATLKLSIPVMCILSVLGFPAIRT